MREYLKALRKQMRLSQTEVAEKLKVASSTYTMIENGERQKDLNLSFIVKLSKIFDVSVDYIIAEENKLFGNEIR